MSNIQDGLPTVINCIFWENADESGAGVHTSEISGRAVVSYSCIQDRLRSDAWPGEGNTNADPCFVDSGYWDTSGTPDNPDDDLWIDGDYHLRSQMGRWDPSTQSWDFDQASSPCIDAGDPAILVGLGRFPNGSRINMGAYGGTPEASLSPSQPSPSIGAASNPYPADGAVDVERSVTLTWTAGLNAVAHTIYFGVDFDTVDQGDRDNSQGTLVSRNQANSYFDLGTLASGETYYWRIDETRGDETIVTGQVWSFTTAPSSSRRR